MANFRTNYKRGSRGRSTNPLRMAGFVLILSLAFIVVLRKSSNVDLMGYLFGDSSIDTLASTDRFYLPANSSGDIYHKTYYSFSYSEKHEQAEWVAYVLERETLNQKRVDRTDNFRADQDIAGRSSDPNDFRGSGYDRGHLVPAADMGFNKEAMSTTFLMSNISPQVRAFNGGIWRELEELTRGWGKYFKRLYVVSGPILNEQPIGYIGRNNVSIPAAYFKVLLDVDDPEKKGIAFLIPNAVSNEPLERYMLSIDSLEAMTGFDFYADLLEESLEEELESSYDSSLWRTNEKKFRLRVEKWNNR